jgi:hypothetical protein
MPDPTRISALSTYSGGMIYEQNCKCGTTEVFATGESFEASTLGDYGWKMVCIEGGTLESLACTNISALHCAKLTAVTYVPGQEIVATIEIFSVVDGVWIVYKDCNLS